MGPALIVVAFTGGVILITGGFALAAAPYLVPYASWRHIILCTKLRFGSIMRW